MRAFVIRILFAAAGVSWLPVTAWAENLTKVEYVGGTVAELRPGEDVRIGLADPSLLTLATKQSRTGIFYSRINQLEYGQRIGRNLVGAIVISPLFLLQKTRKHFVTLGFLDDQGRQQAVVIRVDKGDIRALLAGLEARTGLRVHYQNDEARKM